MVGLCETCLHCRLITSDRGSVFYQCARHAAEPQYPKYPRLPVRSCPGYEKDPRSCGGVADDG
jgi:hypothetical protein